MYSGVLRNFIYLKRSLFLHILLVRFICSTKHITQFWTKRFTVICNFQRIWKKIWPTKINSRYKPETRLIYAIINIWSQMTTKFGTQLGQSQNRVFFWKHSPLNTAAFIHNNQHSKRLKISVLFFQTTHYLLSCKNMYWENGAKIRILLDISEFLKYNPDFRKTTSSSILEVLQFVLLGVFIYIAETGTKSIDYNLK